MRLPLTPIPPRWRLPLALAGLWLALTGLLAGFNPGCLSHVPLQVEIRLTAFAPGPGVLYLLRGNGFRHAERRNFTLQGKGQEEQFAFDLPAQAWGELRLGLLDQASPWLIHELRLRGNGKTLTLKGNALAAKAKPGNETSRLLPTEPGLQVSGSGAKALRLRVPALNRLGGLPHLFRLAGAGLGLTLLLAALAWLGLRLQLQAKLAQAWGQGAGYSWLVAGVALVSLVMSLLHAQQTWDPHHWGLMLSNAQDLLDGKAPYQEIFIQYGILTTLVQTAALALGGADYLSLAIVTSLFYGAGLFFAYRLWSLFLPQGLAAFAGVAAFLCHAILFYPWSNYLAFGVAAGGLLLLALALSREEASPKRYVASGLTLGLAVLFREETALFLGLTLFCFFLAHLFFARREGQALLPLLKRVYLPLVLGGLGVEAIFFLYLASQGTTGEWIHQSIDLKRYYVDEQFALASRKVSLWGHLWQNLNPFAAPSRKVFFSYLLLLNFALVPWLGWRLWQRELRFAFAAPILLSSLAGMFFYLSALHVHEVFRLQTGGILTLGAALYLLQELRFRGQHLLGRHAGMAAVALLIGAFHHSAFWGKDGQKNQFDFQRVASPWQVAHGPLERMKLTPALMEMYHQVDTTLARLQQQGCNLTRLENATTDGLYPLLLPLERVHKMPYLGDPANPLARRFQSIVDPGVNKRVQDSRETQSSLILAENPLPLPANYAVAAVIPVPEARAFIGSQELIIAAPRACQTQP